LIAFRFNFHRRSSTGLFAQNGVFYFCRGAMIVFARSARGRPHHTARSPRATSRCASLPITRSLRIARVRAAAGAPRDRVFARVTARSWLARRFLPDRRRFVAPRGPRGDRRSNPARDDRLFARNETSRTASRIARGARARVDSVGIDRRALARSSDRSIARRPERSIVDDRSPQRRIHPINISQPPPPARPPFLC
jgi:hypothetical protein